MIAERMQQRSEDNDPQKAIMVKMTAIVIRLRSRKNVGSYIVSRGSMLWAR